MENNSRRNPKVQSVMHELSHGSNSHKKQYVDILLFLSLVPLGIFLPAKYIQILGIVVCITWLARNWSINKYYQKVNEPKTGNPYLNYSRRANLLFNLAEKPLKKSDIANNIILQKVRYYE
jgi:hypothetical protein